MSIGAGINQIPLINEAKKIGFHIIGVDQNPTAPGFLLCDLKIQESIGNYKDIYKILREMLVDGKICGIMSKSYGVAIKTTSYLTEKFNIPFLPFKRSDDFINKKIMKSIFKKNSILTPRQYIINRKDNFNIPGNISFPLICKPAIGHAKIGVTYIKNESKMMKILNKSESIKSFIFEEYVRGDEIIAAGIIYNKKYYLIDIIDKTTTPLPNFVDIMHTSPSKHFDLQKEITNIGQSITDSFDITNSPMIMELVVTGDKELHLIEAVPEFGGEFIPDILIPNRNGYNFIGQFVKAMTGNGFKPPSPGIGKNSVIIKYITGEEGILTSCNPEAPMKMKGVIFTRIFKEIGSKVIPPRTNHDRIGVIAVKSKPIDRAIEISEQAVESLNIRIK
ncbi:ATP-grasp domain-containing protein [Spirochaetota bacterium]